MTTVINFNIGNSKYAIIFDTNAGATEYLNSLVDKLRTDGDLKSFHHTSKNNYSLKTDSKMASINVSPAASKDTCYELDYSVNGNYAKTYRSKDLDELVKIAHINVPDHSEYEDVVGEWTNDNEQTYTLYVINGEARTRYTDLLSSLDFDSSPLLKPVLGVDDNNYQLKKITKPSSSLVFSALESFLFVWLGIIICLVGTNSYIKTVSNIYGSKYLVKDHLRQTVSNNAIGLIIGLFLNALIITATHSDLLSNYTFNWSWAIITGLTCLIVFPHLYRKIDEIDE